MADIQPLTRQHDRDTFDCGVEPLNVFLRTTAIQHQDKGVSRTFVLTDPAMIPPSRILGFFTLSACEGLAAQLPPTIAKSLPRQIPAVLLGRLAIDREFQSQGYGSVLLFEAIRRVAATSTQIGIAGLFVDAKDAAALSFYRKFGFISLASDQRRLFLPLATLRQI